MFFLDEPTSGLDPITSSDAEGDRARTELAGALDALDAQARRFVEQREEAAAKRRPVPGS